MAQRVLLPDKQYVDGAYCNGKTLALLPVLSIRVSVGFRLEDFDIDLEKQRALCPAGKTATVFNPSSQPDVDFHVRFGKQCQDCHFQPSCTTEKRGRSLEISPYHQLSRRRREQADTAFVKEMHARARIESTILNWRENMA